jgi:hypothetical protein
MPDDRLIKNMFSGPSIDSDGPEVAALSSRVFEQICHYKQRGMSDFQAQEAAETWLYSLGISNVPERLFSLVLAEAVAMMP